MKIVKYALLLGSFLGFIILIALLAWSIGVRNDLIILKEDVKMQQSQIEETLQRRLELIPDFVETVNAYANYEEELFSKISDAYSNLSDSLKNDDWNNVFIVDNDLNNAINSLSKKLEKYPEFKASEHFTALQDELAGSTNRISFARQIYNEKVQTYNNKVLTFPYSIIADIFGFETLEYFKAHDSANDLSIIDF